MKRSLLFLFSMMMLMACHTEKEVSDSAPVVGDHNPPLSVVASPQVVIYKMRTDYSQNVPVTLSGDKKAIVSYPHPRDVYTNGKLAIPTQLKEGYWLDNRGINENVAFLSYTYEEYAALSNVPAMAVLYSKIIDKDPITEMWVCGYRHHYHDLVNDLNEIIINNKLEGHFKRVK